MVVLLMQQMRLRLVVLIGAEIQSAAGMSPAGLQEIMHQCRRTWAFSRGGKFLTLEKAHMRMPWMKMLAEMMIHNRWIGLQHLLFNGQKVVSAFCVAVKKYWPQCGNAGVVRHECWK